MIKHKKLLNLLKKIKSKEDKFNIIIFDNNININGIIIRLNELIENKVLNFPHFFTELNKKLLETKNFYIKSASIIFMTNSYKELEKNVNKIILPFFKNLECEFENSFKKTYNKKIKIELETNKKYFENFKIIISYNLLFYFDKNFLKNNSFKNLYVQFGVTDSFGNYNNNPESELDLSNIKVSETIYIEGINNIKGKLNICSLNNLILKYIHEIEEEFFSNINSIKEELLLKFIDKTDIDKNLSKIKITKKILIESCCKNLKNFNLKNLENVIMKNLKLENVKFDNIKNIEFIHNSINNSEFQNIENILIDINDVRGTIFNNIKNIEIEKGNMIETKFKNIKLLKIFDSVILYSNFNYIQKVYFLDAINENLSINNINELIIYIKSHIKTLFKNFNNKKIKISIAKYLIYLLDIIYQANQNNIKIFKLNIKEEIKKEDIDNIFKDYEILHTIVLKLIDMILNKKTEFKIEKFKNKEIKFLLCNKLPIPKFILDKHPQMKNKIISLIGNI